MGATVSPSASPSSPADADADGYPVPFSERFAPMAEEFYRIAFLPDGFPGRREPNGTITPHPIYPVYVLDDWLQQYEVEPTPELAAAIRRVATATVERLVDHHGAAVAWYEPGGGSRLFERHYSALTQGYYAVRLWRVGDVLDDTTFHDAARKAFAALLVPSSRGGVLFEDGGSVSVAEVPQEPNSYILNGWQSALVSAWEFYELSGDERAEDLVMRSARSMVELLPLYDAPELRNSRYGLTGFVYLRLRGEGQRFGGGRQRVGDGPWHELASHPRSRWEAGVVPDDVADDGAWEDVRINAIASLVGTTVVEVDLDGQVEAVEAYVGRYDPLASAPVDGRWVEVGSWSADGSTVTIEVPDAVARAVVYPTNFLKEIDGRPTNVYHAIHIRRLRELHAITGLPEFERWADRWASYICEWDDLELYQGLATRLPDGGTAEVGSACGR